MQLSDNAKRSLKDRYTVGLEEPEDVFRRVAKYYATDSAHGERLLEYMERRWFMPSSPILANGGTDRGLPISCYLNHVADDRQGIGEHITETLWLSTMGGGCGTYFGDIRSKGQKTSRGTETTGAMQFMHVLDSLKLASNQGNARQGSIAEFMPISHPEIVEFILMRKSEGDIHRKNQNLDFGVCITDDFMRAVVNDESWSLVDPHSKQVTGTISAAYLWELILETRASVGKGEPYLIFIDRMNEFLHPELKEQGFKVQGSNLCVAPETKILTDMGWVQISDASGKTMNVWNGKQWSAARVEKTSDLAKLIKVKFSDGSELDCTEYHKFHIQRGYDRGTGKNKLELLVKDAQHLVVGDKIQKFSLPVIEFTEEFEDAYTQGFFTGDGSANSNDTNHIDLYGAKDCVLPRLNTRTVQEKQITVDRRRVLISNNYQKFEVPMRHTIKSRLDWFAGLCDADGTLCLNGTTPALQVGSINKPFLDSIRLMLQTLGVFSKVTKSRDASMRMMPDGHGGEKLFECQPIWRLLIGANGIVQLMRLGFNTTRIKLGNYFPNRNAEQFVKVVSIEDCGRFDATYCFNEPIEHKGIFNGILTGNCSEIALATRPDYTNVCCLSSVITETFGEWQDHDLFIGDCIEFLDNVLVDFINKCPEPLWRARKAAEWERSIGLGQMGFHSFLQSNMVSMSSPAARGYNLQIAQNIHSKSKKANSRLAKERGPAKGLSKDRFAHLIAIAPNASTSIFADTSPTIEPWDSNYFVQDTISGPMETRNKYLARLLEERYGRSVDDAWHSVLTHEGSVQQLKKLTDYEKEVFRTAYEINMLTLVNLAADRQKYVCQAQSFNTFFPANSSREYVDDVHFEVWAKGLKSAYYFRTKSERNGNVVSFKPVSEECTFACSG